MRVKIGQLGMSTLWRGRVPQPWHLRVFRKYGPEAVNVAGLSHTGQTPSCSNKYALWLVATSI
jgi:hypothetical protein